MYTSLEISGNSRGAARRTKTWLLGSGKVPNRRFISQLMCRLPLLTLWTLIAIFVLYKSIGDSELSTGEDGNKIQVKVLDQYETKSESGFEIDEPSSQSLNRRSSPQQDVEIVGGEDNIDDNVTHSNVITRFPMQNTLMTTVKESTNEYARLSKVFILIMQDENFRGYRSAYKTRRSQSSLDSSNPSLNNVNAHQLYIPNHIRLLIDILESHRIEYSLDSTRNGLPTSLLTDQNSNTKQFSVIVIDDFIKYTKLSRWVRDQLDRHCRSNGIGVVAYLTSESTSLDKKPTSDGTNRHHTEYSSMQHSTASKQLLTDQFPMTIRALDQKVSCRNISSNSCLFDYQLNERSPILRVLKRKHNYILKGPLVENLHGSPWISMSSSHVTYEPITWARMGAPILSDTDQLDTIRTRRASPFVEKGDLDDIKAGQTQRQSAISNTFISEGKVLDRVSVDSGDNESISKHDNSQRSTGHVDGVDSSLDRNRYRLDPVDGKESTPTLGDAQYTQTTAAIDNNLELQVLSIYDRGLYDGIKRVIFGGANHHWLNRILLLDAIEHLSSGQIMTPLDRYIQVDIDDIFVGERGKRMNRSDVDALVDLQNMFAKSIDGGFKFNLGFSGKYFKHGTADENLGDERLIERANEFSWFCHFWSHSKAHLFNDTQGIVTELKKNLDFARDYKLPLIGHSANSLRDHETMGSPLPATYAVAPHHSGGK